MELAVDMISLAFIVELVVLFSGLPRLVGFVLPNKNENWEWWHLLILI